MRALANNWMDSSSRLPTAACRLLEFPRKGRMEAVENKEVETCLQRSENVVVFNQSASTCGQCNKRQPPPTRMATAEGHKRLFSLRVATTDLGRQACSCCLARGLIAGTARRPNPAAGLGFIGCDGHQGAGDTALPRCESAVA